VYNEDLSDSASLVVVSSTDCSAAGYFVKITNSGATLPATSSDAVTGNVQFETSQTLAFSQPNTHQCFLALFNSATNQFYDAANAFDSHMVQSLGGVPTPPFGAYNDYESFSVTWPVVVNGAATPVGVDVRACCTFAAGESANRRITIRHSELVYSQYIA